MESLRRRRGGRADCDRGAVLVEMAMVLPILVMLLFGVVSAGLAWNQNLALAQATRIGGRYAATLPTNEYASLDDYLDEIATKVVAASEGNLASTVSGRVVCVAYISPANLTTDKTRKRYETSSGVTRGDSACFSDGQPASERHVQVLVERSTTIETGVWSRTVTLHQQAIYRYEVSNGL